MADKFKTGVVRVEFDKDFPYMTSLETDDKGKFVGQPIKNDALKEPQFKKGDRVKLKYSLAGKIVANGYASLLDDKYQKVDTKIASKPK